MTKHIPYYKLTYFNITGLAEPIRLIFAHAGVTYDDERLEHGASWESKKASTPTGQVPVLECDGKFLNQSKAISTFLAKRFGLDGQNEWESAQVQALIADLDDVKALAKPWRVETNVPKKAELFQKLEHDVFLPFMDRLEKTLKANGTGYFVGSHLTQADLHLFNAFERWNHANLIDISFKKHTELVKFVEKIGHLPNIKQWLDHRPKTE